MAVSDAPETPVSRKRMRFTVPPARTYSGSWGYGSEEEILGHSQSDGGNGERQDEEDEQGQKESQSDQETSESDVDDDGLDEEDEQVENERQIDQELSESDNHEECRQDEEDEQERQMDQEGSESDSEDEEQDEEDNQVEQERQMDRECSDSDDEDEEQNEVDEQVQEERQMHEESSESDSEDEEQDEEELPQEEESQNNQASIDAAGGGEEGEEEEDEQVEDVSDGGRVQKSSSLPELATPPSKRTAITNMTLDEDMLDCGVCCLPLKPPIFQCDVGHVVCSSCRNKMAAVGRCHVCRTSITGGYRRCHALEQLVESIRVSCRNATYGCAARVPYYDLHAHLLECPHTPCHCPAEACGFVGSKAALLHHFVDTHKWPCITGVQNGETRVTHLHDGFNFMSVVHEARKYLFLLRVVRSPFGRAISSLCIHPQAAAADDSSPSPSINVSCRLQLFYMRGVLKNSGMLSHLQDSNFEVACTDLSIGMPDLCDCFQFIVPNDVQPETEATVKVEASFTIR